MKCTETIKGLGQGVTLFPGLAAIFGRNASLLLAQILYWTDDDQKQWTHKNRTQIEAATTLTWREQQTARLVLREKGVLEEKRSMEKSNISFRINHDVVNELFSEHMRSTHMRSTHMRSTHRGCALNAQAYAPNAHAPQPENAQNKIRRRKNDADSSSSVRGGMLGDVVLKKSFSEKASLKLYKSLASHQLIQRPPNYKLWIKAFDQLLKEVGKEKIKAALFYYCDHLQEKYMPKAYSAETFREKFDSIYRRMKDADLPEKAEEIILPSAVLESFENVRDSRAWPRHCVANLEEAFKYSYANFKPWWKAHIESGYKKVRGTGFLEEEQLSAFDDMLENTYATVPEFLQRWFFDVFERIKDWDKWSGKFTPDLCIHAKNVRLHDIARKQCEEFTRDDENVEEFWERYLRLTK